MVSAARLPRTHVQDERGDLQECLHMLVWERRGYAVASRVSGY